MACIAAFLIGLLAKYKTVVRVPLLCDTVKTCYEATYGGRSFEFFSQQRFVGFGKSPRTRGRKCQVVKRQVFLESPRPSEEATSQSCWTREGPFVEAKLCNVTSMADVISTGLTLTVSHPFLNLRKSMANV